GGEEGGGPRGEKPSIPHDRKPRPGDVVNSCTMSLDLFPKSCNAHDVCYQTAGVSRKQCDDEFFENAYAERPDLLFSRNPWPNPIVDTSPLLNPAQIYYIFIRSLGSRFDNVRR